MTLLEAIVLGIVQGLTEFLPISSTAHLVLIPALMGWGEVEVPFVVLLHAGTLIALLIYFWREMVEALDGIDRPGPQRRFIYLIVLGTIPAAIIGAVFEKQFEQQFGHPLSVAYQLIVTGILLVATEIYLRRRGAKEHIEEMQFSNVEKIAAEVSWWNALTVGFAQALSIIPGISRSGATIGAGIFTGLSRAQAARFSFMLSVPILMGTSIIEAPELLRSDIGLPQMIAGFLAALVSGYFAIAGMIGYLQKRGLFPFAAYCLVIGPIVAFFLAR